MLLSAPLESFNVYMMIAGLMSPPLSWQSCLLKWCKPYLHFTLRPTNGSFLLSLTPSPSTSLRREVFLIVFPSLRFSTKSVLPTGELASPSSSSTLLLGLKSLTNSSLEGFLWLTPPGCITEESLDRNSKRNLKQKPWWNHACWFAHRLTHNHFLI